VSRLHNSTAEGPTKDSYAKPKMLVRLYRQTLKRSQTQGEHMTQQPKALQLADELEMWTQGEPAAAELRRQEAVNAQLLEALEDVCTQFLGRGVTVDPEHPDHVALKKAEAAIKAANGQA
jgi:hypothetical protein